MVADSTNKKPETRVPVSAVVLTFNEALNIERCLASVAGWCDDLHVVDSGSTDGTVEIARRYTSDIYSHPYVDHASQWTWAFSALPLKHNWILLLDADNFVTDELKHQMAGAVCGPDQGSPATSACTGTYFAGEKCAVSSSGGSAWCAVTRPRSITLSWSTSA
jgi:glycosyltransferase involved in cell wall biosynthesis